MANRDLLYVHREVETVTREYQSVTFTTSDLNALFPHFSPDEVITILQLEEHPDHRWIMNAILNDHYNNLKGKLELLDEITDTKHARIEII